MASVNGTIPTEGLPGAPTLTVFRVTTDRAGEAIDVPGIASTDAATMASARARRVRRAPSRFGRVSMCSHRRALDILERACHELGGTGCSWLTSSRASRSPAGEWRRRPSGGDAISRSPRSPPTRPRGRSGHAGRVRGQEAPAVDVVQRVAQFRHPLHAPHAWRTRARGRGLGRAPSRGCLSSQTTPP
jgi:hypothetical protein